jgi:hypothetical protein
MHLVSNNYHLALLTEANVLSRQFVKVMHKMGANLG